MKTYTNLCQQLAKFFLDWKKFQIEFWRKSKHAAHAKHILMKIVPFTT